MIRSVQSVSGKSSKLPSHEEFFSEESQTPATSLARSFNQLRLSRPLLRAINEMGFTTPTPIQVRCEAWLRGRRGASRSPWLGRTSARRRRRAAGRPLRTCCPFWSGCCSDASEAQPQVQEQRAQPDSRADRSADARAGAASVHHRDETRQGAELGGSFTRSTRRSRAAWWWAGCRCSRRRWICSGVRTSWCARRGE